jgi:FkbH-like protein
MSEDLYAGMSWLPRAPGDFRERCKALSESGDASGIAALARCALDENQLRRLTGLLATFRAQDRSLAPLIPFRLGVLGNGTLEPVIPALIATAARHGIALECLSAEFSQTVQTALSADSAMNRAKPDAVLLALDYRGLPLLAPVHDERGSAEAVETAIGFVRQLTEALRRNGGATSIVQTIAPPAEALFGSFDSALPGTMRSLASAFNRELAREVAGNEDVLLDVAALAETVGLAAWHSPTQWNVAKLAFNVSFLPLYADHVCRVIAALCGKSRKCLVLDLDNTLWGGIIGDDGLEGIQIAQGDATGEAYLSVQRAALALRERGVVLAVSSKNDDDVARLPFRRHPDMLLREEHIAVFQANWNDKATNIAAIARELNLSTDAMVFLDDNPVERALVREVLPDVAVPELPANPALFARTLAAAGYFEAIAFSEEDRKRAGFYQGNARRAALQEQAVDLDAYLASLNMHIVFRPFDGTGRSRIAQLINKSNQFNLTTRRYTEADVAAIETDARCFTLQVRLLDAFGDNGMISVVICRRGPENVWEIDTWLMSCRVLGRGVERMVLREIVLHARERGIETLIGVYRPTGRNAMVSDHYPKLPTRTVVDAVPMSVDRADFSLTPA